MRLWLHKTMLFYRNAVRISSVYLVWLFDVRLIQMHSLIRSSCFILFFLFPVQRGVVIEGLAGLRDLFSRVRPRLGYAILLWLLMLIYVDTLPTMEIPYARWWFTWLMPLKMGWIVCFACWYQKFIRVSSQWICDVQAALVVVPQIDRILVTAVGLVVVTKPWERCSSVGCRLSDLHNSQILRAYCCILLNVSHNLFIYLRLIWFTDFIWVRVKITNCYAASDLNLIR